MNEQLRKSTDRFVTAVRAVNGIYFARRTIFNRFGAMLLTLSDELETPVLTQDDAEQARRAAERLGVSADALPVLAALCRNGDSHTLRRAERARHTLERRFFPSAHLTTAAWLMALDWRDVTAFDQVAAEARQLYDQMRRDDPFRTASEDVPLCVLYALNGEGQAARRLDETMHDLRPVFRPRNSVQALAEVLVFAPEAGAQRTMELTRALNSRGLRLGRGNSLAALGALAAIPQAVEEVADQVAAAELRLRRAPELSGWSVSGKERLMWSCLLVGLANAAMPEQKRLLSAAFTAALSAYLPDPLEEPELTAGMF